MPSTSVFCGALLIIIGIGGYIYGMATGSASPTALIPAAFGVVLVLLGYFAGKKENLRKHLMHVAVLLGLLGFLASGGRLASKLSQITLSAAFISQILMALICLAFVILSVRSFIEARKNA